MRLTLTLTTVLAMFLANSALAETADEYLKRIDKKVASYSVNGVSFNMVVVVPNWFYFGDEESTNSIGHMGVFMIGQTEVTQELFQAVMGYNPSVHRGPQLPVENVSWNESQMFILKLNMITGLEFCLPTECEWECTAKGGSKIKKYKYSGSNKVNKVCWSRDNSQNTTHQIATLSPNGADLYDMSGNVAEWCSDWYMDDEETYRYGFNTLGTPQGRYNKSTKMNGARVYRGGSYADSPDNCSVFVRHGADPGTKSSSIGLRLAMRVLPENLSPFQN